MAESNQPKSPAVTPQNENAFQAVHWPHATSLQMVLWIEAAIVSGLMLLIAIDENITWLLLLSLLGLVGSLFGLYRGKFFAKKKEAWEIGKNPWALVTIYHNVDVSPLTQYGLPILELVELPSLGDFAKYVTEDVHLYKMKTLACYYFPHHAKQDDETADLYILAKSPIRLHPRPVKSPLGYLPYYERKTETEVELQTIAMNIPLRHLPLSDVSGYSVIDQSDLDNIGLSVLSPENTE